MIIRRWDVFESRDLVRLLGISERELRYWAVLGIIKPQFGAAVGKPGIRRRYSFRNLVEVGLVQMLLANHISLHVAPKFLRFVAQAGFYLWRPTRLYLVVQKGDLVRAYVLDQTPRKSTMKHDWTSKTITDLGDPTSTSLGDHLEQLLEDPDKRDFLVVIAVHHVRDRLAKQLGKNLSDL